MCIYIYIIHCIAFHCIALHTYIYILAVYFDIGHVYDVYTLLYTHAHFYIYICILLYIYHYSSIYSAVKQTQAIYTSNYITMLQASPTLQDLAKARSPCISWHSWPPLPP